MVEDNILHRSSEYSSKLGRVYYSLTEDVRKMRDLNILGLSEDHIQFKRIYKKFFLYEILHSRPISISSERWLDEVLLQLKVSRNNLNWEKVTDKSNYFLNRDLGSKQYNQYLNGGDAESKMVIYHIDYTYQPIPEVWITKREYWEATKYSKTIFLTKYMLTLPGASIKEMSKYDHFSDSKFEYDIIKKALILLKQNGLIKIALIFRNEIRYVIADEKLHKLIRIIGDTFKQELSLLIYKWRHFSEEIPEEEDRLKWIFDEKVAKSIVQAARISRYENRKAREKCKGIVEYKEYLKQKCVSKSELLLIDKEFETYNNKRKNNKDTTKSQKKDIQEYFKIREEHFKEIESNFVNKIKVIKKNYKKTIQEYSFLFRHILSNFCPLLLKQLDKIAFKPINREEFRRRAGITELILSAAMEPKQTKIPNKILKSHNDAYKDRTGTIQRN
jgi:hypothetical protein